MELLLIILIIIVAFLTYLLLKKERVLGINVEDKKEQVQTKVIENKNYIEVELKNNSSVFQIKT